MNIYNTLRNCWKLKSLKLFKMLYNEVPFRIKRIKYYNAYFITNKEICIEIGSLETHLIETTVLHEVGHYIDFMKINESKRLAVFQSWSQIKEKEKRAWKNAIRLSNKYDIDLNYKFAKKSLDTYNCEYRVIENKIRKG